MRETERRLGERLDVPEDVFRDAVALYRELEGEEIRAGDDETLPTAVLYIAVRQRGVARSIDELAAVADVSPGTLYRTAREVSDVLGEGIPPVEPGSHVARLVDRFDLDPAVESTAFEILAAAKSEGYHTGRKPAGVAAGALYAALDAGSERPCVTQRELGRAADVHVETVRDNYRRMAAIASGEPTA